MSVLFVGDIGVDTTLVVSHLPAGDEKVVADAATEHVGGVVANAAYAATLAGAGARLLCTVGSDAAGREAVDRLRAEGVGVEAATVPGVTGRAVILIDAEGEKRLVLVPGASMYPSQEAVGAVGLARTSWVHTAAYDLDAAALLAGRCRAAGVPFSVDLEPATIPRDFGLLAPVLFGAAVVFCNERAAARLGEHPANRLLGLGALGVVRTLGARGVRLVLPDGRTDVPPPLPAVAVVDTTGAGDCLAGWFAGRLDAGDDRLTALSEAVAAASMSCARPGAQPSYPSRAEVLSALGAAPTDPGASTRAAPTHRGTP